jgi:hypothetical protein
MEELRLKLNLANPYYCTKENYHLTRLNKQDAIKEVDNYRIDKDISITDAQEKVIYKFRQQVYNYIAKMSDSDTFNIVAQLHAPINQILAVDNDELLKDLLDFTIRHTRPDDILFFYNSIILYHALKHFKDSGIALPRYTQELTKYEKARTTAQKYSRTRIFLDLFPTHPSRAITLFKEYGLNGDRPKCYLVRVGIIINTIIEYAGLSDICKTIRNPAPSADEIAYEVMIERFAPAADEIAYDEAVYQESIKKFAKICKKNVTR